MIGSPAMASLAYLHVRRLTPALEGVVAKPVRSLYRPGERGWIKVKNRAYWKYPIEVDAVRRRVAPRAAPQATATI